MTLSTGQLECQGKILTKMQVLSGMIREILGFEGNPNDPEPLCRRIASALAIGCIYRSKGGIALLGMVGYVTETLIAVARASAGISHVWLLHSLWLVANAAGLSFMPNVKVCP